MKHFNFILIIIPLIVLFYSCTEGIEINNSFTLDNITLQFDVPTFKEIDTRNSDSDINNITFFIFSEDGETLYQTFKFKGYEIKDNSIVLKLNGEAKNKPFKVYAVANTDIKFEKDETPSIELIENKTVNNTEISPENLPMSGISKVYFVGSNVNIELKRIVSKVSMNLNSSVNDYSLLGFEIRNIKGTAYIGAGTNIKKYFYDEKDENLTSTDAEYTNGICETFLFPSPGKKSSVSDPAIILLKVSPLDNPNQTYYYSLNFKTDKSYIDIEPNHQYNITINDIKYKGFSSPKEALKNPDDGSLDYIIYDETPEVFSIVTDNIRELGCNESIIMDSQNTETTIHIKCLSLLDQNNTGEQLETAIKPEIKITGDSYWLKISEGKKNLSYYSNSDISSLWDYTISLNEDSKLFTDAETNIEVSWQGLKRNIKVFYKADFDIEEISRFCKTSLKIDDGYDTKSLINNYWLFVSGNGNKPSQECSSSTDAPILYGIKKESMSGNKDRTSGFHFPMPYGNKLPDKQDSFFYEIDFSSFLPNLYDYYFKNITINIEGDSYFKENIRWDFGKYNDKVTLKIDESSRPAYEYSVGKIIFILDIWYSNKHFKALYLTFDLYHTGLFHWSSSNYYETNSNDCAYYYYEVIPMGTNFWLDRNLGAESNEIFAEFNDGQKIGNEKSKGRFYKAPISGENNLTKSSGQDKLLCPYGYRIPTTEEWDKLRLSPSFKYESLVEEFNIDFKAPLYQLDNSNQKIFFPMAGLYDNTNNDISLYSTESNAGALGTGYYWTSTEAEGMGEDQKGKWLKALVLTENSSYYINGNTKKYLMNIRCVADKK